MHNVCFLELSLILYIYIRMLLRQGCNAVRDGCPLCVCPARLQDAVAVQMAAEAESPEYMTTLRAALEAAASEAGSGVSGDSTALARCHLQLVPSRFVTVCRDCCICRLCCGPGAKP